MDHPAGLGLWEWQRAGGAGDEDGGVRWHSGGGTAEAWALETL